MVKVKYSILSLVLIVVLRLIFLLLLVVGCMTYISCNLKPQEDITFIDNSSRKESPGKKSSKGEEFRLKLFKKNSLGRKLLVKDLFEKFPFKEKLIVKNPSKDHLHYHVDNHVDNHVCKLKKNEMVRIFVTNAEKKNLDTELNDILDMFGIFDEGREAINDIRYVVTEPDIDFLYSKTYSDGEFYDLLYNLGFLKLRDIIKVYLKVCKAYCKLEAAIKDVKRENLRKELMDELVSYKNNYPYHLKELFRGTPDYVYSKIMGDNYAHNLIKMENKVRDVIKGEILYSGLHVENRRVD
ncbi:hypothetical protein bpSLO_001181 (plasmid) [Borrelia parkeri]|uniref:BTA121 domain-containing protein surface lipoprotein n=1 Tax=Borrelia parkeri TaxID=141 RepID=UPI001FF3C37B|nr:hypothetical protein [Borrelia parkeri]UPA11328.1 hypothetical protein bpSLO_001181 [Borrelia parkeri]